MPSERRGRRCNRRSDGLCNRSDTPYTEKLAATEMACALEAAIGTILKTTKSHVPAGESVDRAICEYCPTCLA